MQLIFLKWFVFFGNRISVFLNATPEGDPMRLITPESHSDQEETWAWLALVFVLLFGPPFLLPVALLTDTPLHDGFWVLIFALGIGSAAALASRWLGKGNF